jgi:hypothetical protein
MKILRIDMNTLTWRNEDLPDDRKVVGGRALTAKILNAEVSPKSDPLGQEAKLVIEKWHKLAYFAFFSLIGLTRGVESCYIIRT